MELRVHYTPHDTAPLKISLTEQELQQTRGFTKKLKE